jgi:hypothetical protein
VLDLSLADFLSRVEDESEEDELVIDFLQPDYEEDEDEADPVASHDPTQSLYPFEKMKEIVSHWAGGKGWSWDTLTHNYPRLTDKYQLKRWVAIFC